MNFNNVAIVGAGAIGSFYGAKLQKSGLRVQFQTRSGAAALKKEKMKVNSIWGDFSIKADAHDSTQSMEPADLIIVAVKALENIDYYKLLSPLIKKSSVILLIQNGLNIDEKLQELFPVQKVLGATAFVCLNRFSPENIQHLAYGRLDAGYLIKEDEQLAGEVVQLFKSAGVEIFLSGYIRELRWKKLLWNVPFNVLSVLLMKANTKEMIEDKNILRIAIELMKEVKRIAITDGINVTDNDINSMIEKTKIMVPYQTSMLLDFEGHRPMEVDAILGEPLKVARKSGIDVPRMEVLYAELKFFDTYRR
ncbi:MAG: 2-dehydropantoate 2-reductase [Spirochaetes bacterium]|nr:2-dehydropantoate 2-reductase [Spirochaetota bacterium]